MTEDKVENTTCENGFDLAWMFTMTSECDVTTEEMTSSLIGLTAAPIWLLGHFVILSARSRKSKNGRLPAWVTWSLLPHCVADVISCAGAILAVQLFPQVVFAVVVLSIHCTIAMVIVLRHFLCSKTEYDLHGESLVNAGCTVTTCARCPLKFCALPLLMVLTIVSADVTTTDDARLNKLEIQHHATFPSLPWWEITGEVMGGAACLGHWMASLYNVLHTYKSSSHHTKRETGGVLLMVTGNVAYIVTVLWRPVVLWLHTLPWTLTRVGLLGINIGTLLQLWQKRRRKGDKPYHDADVDESLLSTSTGSDVDSQSDVLWDSRWRDRLCIGPTKTNLHKFQPITPAYPVRQCLGQGRSPQPRNQMVTYDLLQSTETSCSRTAEQDTEPEFELNQSLRFPAIPPHRDIPLTRLSPLTPEERHDRVIQWVEKSSPDDVSHVMEVPEGGHEQYRQHSGSFSLPRHVPNWPSSRKYSAIF